MAERTVRLVQERDYDPPRPVEIEQDGRWLPGLQYSWRRWEDDRGWVAEVEYTVVHPWGIRTRVTVLPADQLRLRPPAELPDEPPEEVYDELLESRRERWRATALASRRLAESAFALPLHEGRQAG